MYGVLLMCASMLDMCSVQNVHVWLLIQLLYLYYKPYFILKCFVMI